MKKTMKYFRMDISIDGIWNRIVQASSIIFLGKIVHEIPEKEVDDLIRGIQYARQHSLN